MTSTLISTVQQLQYDKAVSDSHSCLIDFHLVGDDKMINRSFEIVKVSGEYLAVPIGELGSSYNGVIALSEPAAYLLGELHEQKSKEELVSLLVEKYDVDLSRATSDVDSFVLKMIDLGVLEA